MLEQRVSFRKFFDKKHKVAEILFLEVVVNINNFPFLKHNDRGKTHAMMASNFEMEIERDDQKVCESRQDLDWLVQQI